MLGWAHDDYNCEIGIETCDFTQKIESVLGV